MGLARSLRILGARGRGGGRGVVGLADDGRARDELARGRDAGAQYLADFVEEMKASGFVADTLKRNRIVGASVAPAGPARP